MRYDANYYTTKTFISKFKILLDNRYGHLKEHQRRNAFIKAYDTRYNTIDGEQLNTIDNTVKQWFIKKQKPSIEKLMNICELLDCDIDYFLTSQEEFKREIFQASTVTGLNYDSIEKICKVSPYHKIFLNKFILHNLFDDLFENIAIYVDSPILRSAKKNKTKYDIIELHKKEHELKKFNIFKVLDNIIIDLQS